LIAILLTELEFFSFSVDDNSLNATEDHFGFTLCTNKPPGRIQKNRFQKNLLVWTITHLKTEQSQVPKRGVFV
jgi:hypothetical protein